MNQAKGRPLRLLRIYCLDSRLRGRYAIRTFAIPKAFGLEAATRTRVRRIQHKYTPPLSGFPLARE